MPERRTRKLRGVLERALLVCGAIVFALIAGEVAVYVGYWAMRGQRFPRQDYHTAMLEQAARSGVSTREGRSFDARGGSEPIHPYLGFVPDPAELHAEVTIGDPRLIPAPRDGELIAGVFGGSFAAGMCAYAGKELERVLSRPGQPVRMVCLAAGGYKQPQQFLALAYMLAQGAHFDLVINIDGFNEVALPPIENTPQGVAPIYPRGWFWRVGNLDDPTALKLLGEVAAVDRERKEWAGLCVRWDFYRSSLLTAVWRRWDRLLETKRNQILTELRDHKIKQRKSYAATGPAMTFADDTTLYGYLARVWKSSSLQMKLLCDANGITYAHFLQPNQYVEGSKPMSPEERAVAIRPVRYQRGVVSGYPLLRQQGEELRNGGVRFHDLTMVFKDVNEPLYSDGCCHLNAAGYAMIARAIGESVRSDASPEH